VTVHSLADHLDRFEFPVILEEGSARCGGSSNKGAEAAGGDSPGRRAQRGGTEVPGGLVLSVCGATGLLSMTTWSSTGRGPPLMASDTPGAQEPDASVS
jgi:hypothetical protein